jgi:hypothetical protein
MPEALGADYMRFIAIDIDIGVAPKLVRFSCARSLSSFSPAASSVEELT